MSLSPKVELVVDTKDNFNHYYSPAQHNFFFSSSSLDYIYQINLSVKEKKSPIILKSNNLRNKKKKNKKPKPKPKTKNEVFRLKEFKNSILKSTKRNRSSKKEITSINNYTVVFDSHINHIQYKDAFMDVRNKAAYKISITRQKIKKEIRMDIVLRNRRFKEFLKIIKKKYMISVFLYKFFISE